MLGYWDPDCPVSTSDPDVKATAYVKDGKTLVSIGNFAGKDKTMRYDVVPACIYTSPEIASVGLSEEAARAQGLEVETGSFNIAANGRCMVMNENTGFVKLVANKADGRILGCQMLAPRATDMIAEIVTVMELGGTIEQLGSAVHPHPTVSEIIKEAAHDAEGLCVNAMPRKK